MTERWRDWTPPAEIRDDPEEVIVEGDRKSRAYNTVWPEEVVTKIRLGYQCLKCWEPQETPFPEQCGNPVCRYPMKAQQGPDFELEFAGTEQFVSDSQRDWEDLERLAESSERKSYKPGSSIAVPGAKRSAGGVILPGGVDA
jgi:hypothetical protein